MAEEIITELNWDVSQEEMKQQIRTLIANCRVSGKVITLPLKASYETLVMLLAQVNCEGCEAVCCKMSPPDELIALAPSEYDQLVKKHGIEGIQKDRLPWGIKTPCRFLKKNRCTIYQERPVACIAFPMQPGGELAGSYAGPRFEAMAVASYCPEARRIAKSIYMMVWRIKQKVFEIGAEDAKWMMQNAGAGDLS